MRDFVYFIIPRGRKLYICRFMIATSFDRHHTVSGVVTINVDSASASIIITFLTWIKAARSCILSEVSYDSTFGFPSESFLDDNILTDHECKGTIFLSREKMLRMQ